MSDGVQGLRHIVPLKVSTNPDENVRPLRLGVRHYLEKSKEMGIKGIPVSLSADYLSSQLRSVLK